jgi:hypothetical protein
MWDEHERSTIQQAALDVGTAIARDINRVTEQFQRLRELLIAAGKEVQPVLPIEPADAYLKVFGRPVTFLRKADAASGLNWGETRSRDLVWVFRNAPHSVAGDVPATVSNRPEFSVHELGHVFENVIFAAVGVKRGRNSIPPNLVNRPNGFFQLRRFQQSQDPGRGEIFADMFIGWVYNRWETIDGSPISPLRDAGIARKKFMDGIMIDLIEAAMTLNKNP